MDWKKGDLLSKEQTGHPLLWYAALQELGYDVPLPELGAQWFTIFWGDNKTTRRIRPFGHIGKNNSGPHFLCTRGGTSMHTDPGFNRFALQIQLVNHGYLLHGLHDDPMTMPIFSPGLVIIIDTHSPHQLSRDVRVPNRGYNKLLVGADFPEYPEIDIELPKLVRHITSLELCR